MLDEARLKQLASVASVVDPRIGLAADLLVGLIGSRKPSMSDDAKQLLTWIEMRSVKLLEEITDENTSKAKIRELEIRLHETLDILQDAQKETPWN